MQQSFFWLHICEEPAFYNNCTWTSFPLNLHLDDRIKSINLLRYYVKTLHFCPYYLHKALFGVGRQEGREGKYLQNSIGIAAEGMQVSQSTLTQTLYFSQK